VPQQNILDITGLETSESSLQHAVLILYKLEGMVYILMFTLRGLMKRTCVRISLCLHLDESTAGTSDGILIAWAEAPTTPNKDL
jgi:hypothetical protein